MVLVRNVAIGTFSGSINVDAVIDTGSTLCIVPPFIAGLLGFDSSNRLSSGPLGVIGGDNIQIDLHRLEWVRVGSARAFDVKMGVAKTFAGPGARQMLVGLTFISRFRTTFDLGDARVLFSSR
jgi:predicted aspartyl protease